MKRVKREHMTIKEIQAIIKDFEKSSLRTLEIENEGVKIKLSKNEHGDTVVPLPIKQSELEQNITKSQSPKGETINAPLVGTFYGASTPGGDPFVTVGQSVKKGDVVCIIEAMKIMNEITAQMDGKIGEILVHDKDVVSFDQPLMTVVKDYEA